MSIIRVKRSGVTGSPSALAQGEMAYSFLSGTQSNGGDRLYIGTGTETGGVAANIEVIGGKYFTSKLSHVPGTLTNNAAVIVDASGKIDVFNATTLTANNTTITGTLTANGSVGTAGQILTSNGSGVYWITPSPSATNIGQSANSSTITVTSSTGTSTTLAAANTTTAGLLSADAQTIAGAKTFNSTITGSITGNAGTATTLQTARNINGVSFNGSSDIAITAANPNALTIGTGLSGTSYNGSSAVTIAIDSTVATLSGAQSLTNKTLDNTNTIVVKDSLFTIQDDVDTTKQVQFQASGLTTGTTVTLTVPNASGTIATLSGIAQTFTNTTNFSGTVTMTGGTLTFGNGTGTATIGLGVGATTNGNSKAVNIGTSGASGSTTNIAIGSAVSGALGTLTINSPTVAFGSTTTAFNISDSVFTLQDNTDATKQIKFEASGITTGTTRTLTAPDASGTIALTSNKLSAFAATTSAELAGVISDETGSGALVFATSPTLVTPTLGVATATSINKVAITAPATGSTLTIADGKTATFSNTLTLTGTDGSSVAFGAGGTVAYTGSSLAQFASTTSSQLAGVISDETGTGSLVFGTAPTFTTSIDGGATFAAFGSSTALTLGYNGTAASTTNLSTGATATATTKTINIGTGGAAGSTTNINFGSTSGTGTATFNNDLVVTGNLTVNGTTVTMNTSTITVDDINIELGSVASPTDVTAAGGGITLKGTTDKTISWSATNGWTSSETFNLATGKTYKINGTDVLSATTLGSGVTASSLTSVGTITSGTWSASFGAVSGANLTNLTAGNLTGTIPSAVLANSTAYVGTTAIALNRASGNLGLTGITSIAMPGGTSGTMTMTPAAVAGTTAITIPATSGTLVTTGDTGTVTSTMIADGTIVNGDISASAAIAITKLAASTISGVSLGNNLNALTIGTGLSGTSYNGSAGVTIAATIATTSALGIASFDSTNFTVSSGAVSVSAIDGGSY